MARYDQCDGTCTTDCGHCKGAVRPPGRPVVGDPTTVSAVVAWLEQYADNVRQLDGGALSPEYLIGAQAALRVAAIELRTYLPRDR